MAYRFKLTEPFDEGVRRIGLQQIDRALQQLQAAEDAGDTIHATRKGLKRIRALLRLARAGLSQDVYAQENARYRDAGRLLSAARDRHVLRETVTKLEHQSTGRTKLAFAAARTKLSNDTAPQTVGETPATDFAQAKTMLEEGRTSIAKLDIDAKGFSIAWHGMERTYRKASRALDHAYDTLDDEALHEWRKRVQHHWRHMSLLMAAWPEVIAARIATSRQVSMLLGEDHDIAMMLAALKPGAARSSKPGQPALILRATPTQAKLIATFASERQRKLREKARILGRRLFAEEARAFRDRVEAYWAAANAGVEPDKLPA